MCDCIIACDFNCNLDSGDKAAALISSLSQSSSLMRCDHLIPSDISATYVNLHLNQQSYIDYILTSSPGSLLAFNIMDPDINFSDHLPLCATFHLNNIVDQPTALGSPVDNASARVQKRLRWDKGDLASYYSHTSVVNSMICTCDTVIDSFSNTGNRDTRFCDVECQSFVDEIYNEVVTVLNNATQLFIPQKDKNFFKFWWNEELKVAKAASIESNNMWKAAGKPRQGPVFEKKKRCSV